ncbi:MAG: InlB B-repeat-containing protein, partial [Candidatus Bathyarchaeota archaeon]|nr:InlB B-repeat-containing protein [Candidatus Termiticorpusculum sp.]
MNTHINKINNFFSKKRKNTILSITLTIFLLISIFPMIQLTTAATSAVNGRTLTTAITDDTSEWIEIAKNGDYSLILRKDVLTQTSAFTTVSDTRYSNSLVRPIVNTWFTSTLPANARLRSFTVEHNALTSLGSWLVTGDGVSTPTGKQNGNGQDVAFLLSFAEAALFCSTQYASGTGNSYTQSSSTATANFNKLTSLGNGQPSSHCWLRSPGNTGTSGQISTVGYGGFNTAGDQHGAVNSYQGSSNVIHIRPALWVNSTIFATIGVTFNANAPGDSSVVGPTPSSKNVENGATYGTLATVSRTGYNFNGWYTTASAGSLVTSSTTVTTSANHTLY